MERRLFSELLSFYESTREKPKDIRIRIRMRDLIDPVVLRHAVDTAMQRYPYFCVELQKKDSQWFFLDNHRPVVITNSLHGVELNSEASNYHMISLAAVKGTITAEYAYPACALYFLMFSVLRLLESA